MYYNFKYLIFLTLYKLLFFFEKLFNKEIILHFKEFIEKKSYTTINLNQKKLVFFTPNTLVKWRVKTILDKEPETLEWIDNFKLNKKKIFWDIGANIGLYSIYASRKKNLDIYAFEPSTSNLRVLSRNIYMNNLNKKINIVPFALNNVENHFLNFNENEFIEGGALNAFGEKKNYEGKNFKPSNIYKTFGTTINKMIEEKNLNIPNYIKIDVDGIEHLILRKANKILKEKKIESILIELNENYQKQFNEIKNIFKNYNFVLKKKDRNDKYYGEKFAKIYNYIFEKKSN